MHPVRGNALRTILLASAGWLLAAAPCLAATFDLRADKGTIVMPDGRSVPVWGFGAGASPCGTADVTVPGPQLVVPGSDTTLAINLTNCLASPVSITVPGLTITPTPVYDAGSPPRVVSFTYETPGRVGTDPPTTTAYTFANVRPGTFLYESGTDASVQIQMGLYGAAVVRPVAAGQAYDDPRSFFENEIVMVLSEIDAGFHDAVEAGCYVPQGAAPPSCGANVVTSTTFYRPNYYLVNGRPYSDPYTPFTGGRTLETLLIRLLNAGLEIHTMTLQGARMEVIAQDGNWLNNSRQNLFSELIAAGQTLDILVRPRVAGKYAFYDRRLNVTNAGAFPGGLIAFIDVLAGTRTDSLAITTPPSGTPNPVPSGGGVTLSGAATDGLGHLIGYAWAGSCPDLPSGGSFSDPTSQNPVWTTPPNRTGVQKTCTLKMTASDGGWGNVQSASYVQRVDSVAHAILVHSGPGGSPNPVPSRGAASFSIDAEDSLIIHALTFSWSASCPSLTSNGSFSSASAQNPTWTAPLNHTLTPQDCTITVDMNDGAGGLTDSRQFIQSVGPTPHQINVLAGPGGSVNPATPNQAVGLVLSVEDTRLHTLSFAWTASCPTLPSNGSFSDPSVQNPTWTAPLNPTGAPQSCTLQVVADDGAGGLSQTRSYQQGVSFMHHLLNITSGPSPTANTVIAGNSIGVSVAATDTVGHAPTYAWSSSCPLLPGNGFFDDPGAQNPMWTAPSNPTGANQTCTLQVVVADGAGGLTAIGSFTETIGGPCSLFPVLDPFTAAPLDSCWSFLDVRANSTMTFPGDGHLKITIPSTNSHDCWGNKVECARLLREAPNTDAVYETKIDGVNLSGKFSTYGIMLSQGQGACNFLRFEYWSGENGVFVKAYRVLNCNGAQVLSTASQITMGATNYLRVTRSGNTFTLQYGTNLASLITVGSFTQAGFNVTQAGVLVNNAEQRPVTMGSFDYFSITTPGGGPGGSHALLITAGPSAGANPIESGVKTSLAAAASDTQGHAMGGQWSASCPTLPTNGAFNNASSLTTAEWTAPTNLTGSPQDCLLTLALNDGAGGLTQTTQFMQRVNTVPHFLTIAAGPSGAGNPVASGGTANLTVTGNDTLGHGLGYAWSAICTGLPSNGVFNNASLRTPTWTAPANTTGVQQSCTMQVIVDDGAGGLTQPGTYSQAVNPGPVHALTITAGPSGNPNPVASGANVNLTVTGNDTLGHGLGYAWSALCTGLPTNGSFNNAASRTPTWTAPANTTGVQQTCAIQVIVNDGAGGLTVPGTYNQVVNPAPPPGACGTLPFLDNFPSGPLDACWSIVDPRANSTETVTADGHLQVALPAGAPNHDCWNATPNCTRVVRNVPNVDAVYETKIDGTNITTESQDYGIFLYQDSCNYLRASYWTAGGPVSVRAYKITGCVGNGTPVINGGNVTLGAANFLRVTKTGTAFKLEYSQNGTTWNNAGTATLAGFAVNQVGFFVNNAGGNPGTTGRADYFSATGAGAPAHALTITAGPSGTPNPVASGATANLTVTANDTLGHGLGYAWSALCTGLPSNGTFNNAASRTPVWTAPANTTGAPVNCAMQVIVNDGAGGLTTPGNFTQVVNAAGAPAHALTITTPAAGTPSPVASGATANLTVTANDTLGHGLGYTWSALCTGLPTNGVFSSTTVQNPTWTAPANATGAPVNCAMQVIVNDGAGGLTTPGNFTLTVNSTVGGACGTLPFLDNFPSGALGSCWSVVDPRGNSAETITADGHLRVALPAGAPDHDCWNSAANCTRVMRAVPNVNAVYETKIDGTNISAGNQSYGILLFQDSCNYIRFEYWTAGSGVFVNAYKIIGCSGSQALTSGSPVALGAANYLRVTKTGTSYTLAYSQNGTTYTTVGTMTQAGFAVNQVGFVVGDAVGNPATTGNADYFSGQ